VTGRIIVAALVVLALAPLSAGACEPVYRLYRTWAPSTGLPGHVHVATFDSCEKTGDPRPGATYNGTMCEIARGLFQSQPGVAVTFWCERVAKQ
jgi:hypothetical protein